MSRRLSSAFVTNARSLDGWKAAISARASPSAGVRPSGVSVIASAAVAVASVPASVASARRLFMGPRGYGRPLTPDVSRLLPARRRLRVASVALAVQRTLRSLMSS